MPPVWATLDAGQCVRAGFDESTGRFRTDAVATVIGGDITVEIDGVFSLLNTDPDNIGLIGHVRALSPTSADQTNRLTSITNLTVHALDTAIHLSDGSDISALNPLPVSGTVTTDPDVNIHDSAGNNLTSTTGFLDVFVQNFPAIQAVSQSGTWTVNQGAAALPSDAWYMRITDGAVTVGIEPSTFSLNTNNQNGPGTGAVNIQDGGNSITVDGLVAISGSVTVLQGTSPWVVSGTVAATQSGVWSVGRTWTLASGTDSVASVQSGAWTTGRTWTLSSGTDSIAAVQSGTWNINDITGTISLPTGAATSALQTTGNASLVSIDAGIPAALGQTTMANSMPVVIASDQSAVQVTLNNTTVTTYSATVVGLAVAASATDIFTITGSATKTIKVIKMHLSATRTADAKTDILIVKRSTANSGGTSTVETNVPHDSTNAAATAVVRSYTANPTLGTTVGTIRARKQYIPVASSSSLGDIVDYGFGETTGQAIVLNGTSQVLSFNLNGQTITGSSFDISITWLEI